MAQNETRVIQGSRGKTRSKKHRLGENHKVPRGAAGSPVAEAVCGGGCEGGGGKCRSSKCHAEVPSRMFLPTVGAFGP